MRKGKYAKRGIAVKSLVLILTLALLVGGAVGGTLAWLTAQTSEVENTFTDSDINITLTETSGSEYKMIPGHYVTKNPKVTLKADSEPCYLFVQVTEDLGSWSDNQLEKDGEMAYPAFTDYLAYSVITTGDNAWTKLTGYDNVYYIEVEADTTSDTDYQILVDNKVTVAGIVTKEMMAEIDGVDAEGNEAASEKKPTLSFTAYAVQLYSSNNVKFEASAAWEIAKGLNPDSGSDSGSTT